MLMCRGATPSDNVRLGDWLGVTNEREWKAGSDETKSATPSRQLLLVSSTSSYLPSLITNILPLSMLKAPV